MEGGMIKGNFNYDVISKVKKKNFKLEKKNHLVILNICSQKFVYPNNEFRTMSYTHEFFSKKLW